MPTKDNFDSLTKEQVGILLASEVMQWHKEYHQRGSLGDEYWTDPTGGRHHSAHCYGWKPMEDVAQALELVAPLVRRMLPPVGGFTLTRRWHYPGWSWEAGFGEKSRASGEDPAVAICHAAGLACKLW